jgi:hypothetical protein
VLLTSPNPVADATWQAGVTPKNNEYRATLDGEPVPMAYAANVSQGWVLAYVDAGGSMLTSAMPEKMATEKLRGVVQLLRCRGEITEPPKRKRR